MTQDLQKEIERLRRELADSKWRERMWKKSAKSWMAEADALKAKYEPLVLDLCLETPPTTSDHYPSLPTPAKESCGHDDLQGIYGRLRRLKGFECKTCGECLPLNEPKPPEDAL